MSCWGVAANTLTWIRIWNWGWIEYLTNWPQLLGQPSLNLVLVKDAREVKVTRILSDYPVSANDWSMKIWILAPHTQYVCVYSDDLHGEGLGPCFMLMRLLVRIWATTSGIFSEIPRENHFNYRVHALSHVATESLVLCWERPCTCGGTWNTIKSKL